MYDIFKPDTIKETITISTYRNVKIKYRSMKIINWFLGGITGF